MLLSKRLLIGKFGQTHVSHNILILSRIMGSLTNNGRKLANYAGIYKGIQSAGNSIASSIDADGAAYMTNFATNWGLLAGSIVIAAPIVFLKIKNTIDIEEDIKFSDETIADVAGNETRASLEEKTVR
jgi:hypothetical protein